MIKITLPILLFLSAFSLAAQEQNVPLLKPMNKELGLFGQTEGAGNNHYMNMVGFQYKHWRNEHLGLRLIGAFAQYNSNGSELQYITGDTSFSRQEQIHVNMPVVGVGVEAQRHFYRRIYLFAALELKGGYGNGNADTIFSKATGLVQPGAQPFERIGHYDASLLHIGMSASIGARAQFKRLGLGLELLPIQASYNRTSGNGRHNGITDLNFGSFSQRISLNYRF